MKKHLFRFVMVTTVLAVGLSILYILSTPLYEQNRAQKEQDMVRHLLGDVGAVDYEHFELFAPQYLHMGTTQEARRVVENDQGTAIVASTLAQDGYAGPIALMVAFDRECTILGVEIINHAETPGLGDQFLKSDKAWLKAFKHRSHQNTDFRLKKFGGDIDAWTGATVTPKAIVGALEAVLKMCEDHGSILFNRNEVVYIESR